MKPEAQVIRSTLGAWSTCGTPWGHAALEGNGVPILRAWENTGSPSKLVSKRTWYDKCINNCTAVMEQSLPLIWSKAPPDPSFPFLSLFSSYSHRSSPGELNRALKDTWKDDPAYHNEILNVHTLLFQCPKRNDTQHCTPHAHTVRQSILLNIQHYSLLK